MLDPALLARATERGVTLEQVVEVLRPLADSHFGPRVVLEWQVNDNVELYAGFRVTDDASGPAMLSLARAREFFSNEIEPNDELVFKLFVAPHEEHEAQHHDSMYDALIGLSSVACGFWPVAKAALAPLLGLPEDPREATLQRALTFAVATPDERAEGLTLRRSVSGALLLKQTVVVGQGLAAGHFGRRDLVDGVQAEVTRRTVPLAELIRGLFDTDAVTSACEGGTISAPALVAFLAERDVHLARRTAFRASVERLLAEERGSRATQFLSLVSSERDARFVP